MTTKNNVINNMPVIFNFGNKEVRTIVDVNNQTWFVENDITNALGYTNSREVIKKHVDNEDRKGVTIRDTLGKNPQTNNMINECGMYSLVLSSKKKEAKNFKRWVTSEVLPAIINQGHYSHQQVKPVETNDVPDEVREIFNFISQASGVKNSIWQ